MVALKEKRLEQGLTQAQLAQKLKTHEARVSQWERGNTPNKKNKKRLARALNTTVEELFDGN